MQAPAPCKERKERGTPGIVSEKAWATRRTGNGWSEPPGLGVEDQRLSDTEFR